MFIKKTWGGWPFPPAFFLEVRKIKGKFHPTNPKNPYPWRPKETSKTFSFFGSEIQGGISG